VDNEKQVNCDEAARELREYVIHTSKSLANMPTTAKPMLGLPEGFPAAAVVGPLLDQYGPLVTQTALHWLNTKYGDTLNMLITQVAPTAKRFIGDAELAKLEELIELIRKPDSMKVTSH
jgi:hypothetical protein